MSFPRKARSLPRQKEFIFRIIRVYGKASICKANFYFAQHCLDSAIIDVASWESRCIVGFLKFDARKIKRTVNTEAVRCPTIILKS